MLSVVKVETPFAVVRLVSVPMNKVRQECLCLVVRESDGGMA
jgi:hypothetical protein